MASNGWKVVGIILMIVFFMLSIYTVAKMSYSVGYEDGQSGIITMLQIQRQTGNQIITLPTINQEKTRQIVYLILNKFRSIN